MIYKQLGRTGLNVSIIGFGAAPLGNEYGHIDPTEGIRIQKESQFKIEISISRLNK